MKIGFVSNFINHHQKPIADELYGLLGDDYKWIATTPTENEQIRLGYDDLNETLPYVICAYKSEDEFRKAYNFCLSCDCLIVAYDIGDVVEQRMKNHKLTVICSERLCKKNCWQILRLKEYINCLKKYTRYRNNELYFYSIGDFAAKDFSLTFSFPKKCYRWGYFIDVPELDCETDKKWAADEPSIIWAARFIDWKHPEYMVYAAKKLREEGLRFHIEMVGIGELYDKIQNLIKTEFLENVITLSGAVGHKIVREKMLSSHIFCSTSNRQEGWGAVIGEGLSSKSIVIANEKCGASSVLIKNGITGFAFKDDDREDFYNKLKNAIINFKSYRIIAEKGYKQMAELWNQRVAAKRLLTWVDLIIKKEKVIFNDGPCSFIR